MKTNVVNNLRNGGNFKNARLPSYMRNRREVSAVPYVEGDE